MREILIAAYLALACLLGPALCLVWGSPWSASQPVESSPSPAAESLSPSPPTPGPAPETISVLREGELYEMDMQDYLLGVVAAEMPASFHGEALKAQAVAGRTYALYCSSTGKHQGGGVCTDYSCCQAWSGRENLERAWGDKFQENYRAIAQAVAATQGQYLSYEGRPVFAAFHSSSAGATEDSAALWSALPYLVSVDSPETAETVPDYVSQVELSPLDFRDTVLSAYPQADLSGEAEVWLGERRLGESGRVAAQEIGGLEIGGDELRSLFSLRSTAFSLDYTGSSFLFTVTGYGHGVGMSQYGANALAAQGWTYDQILAHYYPGTTLMSP